MDSVLVSRICSPEPSGVQNDFWGPEALGPPWTTSSLKKINIPIFHLHRYKKKNMFLLYIKTFP